jgi:hypothetical protein
VYNFAIFGIKVEGKVFLIKDSSMKAGMNGGIALLFFNSALDGDE